MPVFHCKGSEDHKATLAKRLAKCLAMIGPTSLEKWWDYLIWPRRFATLQPLKFPSYLSKAWDESRINVLKNLWPVLTSLSNHFISLHHPCRLNFRKLTEEHILPFHETTNRLLRAYIDLWQWPRKIACLSLPLAGKLTKACKNLLEITSFAINLKLGGNVCKKLSLVICTRNSNHFFKTTKFLLYFQLLFIIVRLPKQLQNLTFELNKRCSTFWHPFGFPWCTGLAKELCGQLSALTPHDVRMLVNINRPVWNWESPQCLLECCTLGRDQSFCLHQALA